MTARGLRNNNPGNIRKGLDWQGLAPTQPDLEFCTFSEPVYGIRAIAKIVLTYATKHKLVTVRGIINRWAPPVENDTAAYVQHVADRLGVDPDSPIRVTDPAVMKVLVAAIIKHENGTQPYGEDVILKGVEMALGKTVEA
jgi:hypothetical protein